MPTFFFDFEVAEWKQRHHFLAFYLANSNKYILKIPQQHKDVKLSLCAHAWKVITQTIYEIKCLQVIMNNSPFLSLSSTFMASTFCPCLWFYLKFGVHN